MLIGLIEALPCASLHTGRAARLTLGRMIGFSVLWKLEKPTVYVKEIEGRLFLESSCHRD